MAREADREYDKTSLRVLSHTNSHRDYAAHFFRWGFVKDSITNHGTRILDIGCGVDTPLVYVFKETNNFKMIPKSYLGVDFNKPPATLPTGVKKWADYKWEFAFDLRWKELEPQRFDLITCLEVVEHMRMPAMRKLLRGALALLAPGGRLVLSTPVFNGKMAKNHINEMTVDTLAKELDKAGWEVLNRFGTFMSDQDRKKVATAEESRICEALKVYYSSEVIACFLAPLYPDASRNNLWVCAAKDPLKDLL